MKRFPIFSSVFYAIDRSLRLPLPTFLAAAVVSDAPFPRSLDAQHPDDKNEAIFPKILVLIGFTLAQASVLLLPLDVANREGYTGCDGYDTALCGGLNMTLVWEIFFIIILVYVVLLIPFTIFFYEADDGFGNIGKSRFCEAGECRSRMTARLVSSSSSLIAAKRAPAESRRVARAKQIQSAKLLFTLTSTSTRQQSQLQKIFT